MRPLFAYLRAVVAPTAVFAAAEDWGAGGVGLAAGGGTMIVPEPMEGEKIRIDTAEGAYMSRA